MAQLLVCDVCPEIALLTLRFSIEGREHEIDLCEQHHGELRDQVAEWGEFARRPGKPPVTRTTRTKLPSGFAGVPWWSAVESDTPHEVETKKQWRQDMREWGWSHGWKGRLGSLGRIPADLAEAYVEANGLKIDHQRHRIVDPDDETTEDAEDSGDSEPGEQPTLLPKPATRTQKKKPPPKTLSSAVRLVAAK